MEALLRWQHPDSGLLMPGDFIDIAEEMDLIGPIGDWVVRTACRQLSLWRKSSPAASRMLSVAVNLSANQMRDRNLLRAVEQALNDNDLPASCLELEITERVLIDDPKHTAVILHQLAALGVKLALDDFGTGFSSMQHLKLFPIDVLKLDKEFVSTVGQGQCDDRLLAAMIVFAKTLQLTVVAEGVETREQGGFCGRHGCDRLQGFYYARPIPPEEFEARFLLGGSFLQQDEPLRL
jgi:EAL domain-containing protein (putative c-di-GMP-specific phosphodiesterase class I)